MSARQQLLVPTTSEFRGRELRVMHGDIEITPSPPLHSCDVFLMAFVEGLPASPEIGTPVPEPAVFDVGGGDQGPRG